ncbi:MAG TPA: hypothetical protein VHF25_17365 [Nitriliruptorales bacterium]|nr:hypothetical protein [Nitriliruptorales bacterium]
MGGNSASARVRDLTGTDGHVAVVEGALRVIDWRTRSPDIVRYFEDRLAGDGGDDLAEVLELALKVGVVALSTVGVSANVDYVEKEFQRFSGQLQGALEERLAQLERALDAVFADGDGSLARALQRYLGDGGHLSELFDPERRDSAVSRLRELLDDHLGGESSTLHQLLDVTSGTSPLRRWKEEIDQGLDRIRRQLEDYRLEIAERAAADSAAATARADEREKGTGKGRDYESQVFAAVGAIAAVFGDGCEPTGDATGVGASKVGDVVVTVNPRDTRGAEVRLVFEAKDRAVGLTPLLRELDAARENRGAAAAVAVCSREEHLPAGSAPFREQGAGRYLCMYDKEDGDALCLQVVYRLARFWALAELTAHDGEVDVRGVQEDLEAARRQLQNVTTAKATLTRLRTSVDATVTDVQAQLDTLRADLNGVLDRVEGRIRVAG